MTHTMELSSNIYGIEDLPWGVSVYMVHRKTTPADVYRLLKNSSLDNPIRSTGHIKIQQCLAIQSQREACSNWLLEADHCHCCVVASVFCLISNTSLSGSALTTLPACAEYLLHIINNCPTPGLFK